MIRDSGWRIPDALFEQMLSLLPVRLRHPLSCRNPNVPGRAAMGVIFFALLSNSPKVALSANWICLMLSKTVGSSNRLNLGCLTS